MTDEGRERMTRAHRGATSSARPRTSWPTPNTPTGGGNLMSTPNHTGGIDLEGAVELWQTPSVSDVTGGAYEPIRGSVGRDASEGASAGIPDTSGAGLAQRNGGGSNNEAFQPPRGSIAPRHDRALFPPGPVARDEWATILRERPDLTPAVESEVRGVASGTSGGLDFSRQDQLRSLGNLVVPLQGAAALLVLLKRLD
jgi:hypothetical protein